MLVSAIRTEAEDDEDDETDSLASSMMSRKSIEGANMTMKPGTGNMTFPTVSKRDKRRLKDEGVCFAVDKIHKKYKTFQLMQ